MSSFALFQKFILLSVTSRLINDHFPLIGSHLTYKDHLRQVGVKLRQSRESELKGESLFKGRLQRKVPNPIFSQRLFIIKTE